MTAISLTPAQTVALARLLRKQAVRVKELLELEDLRLVRRLVPTPTVTDDWELTPEGRRAAEEISY